MKKLFQTTLIIATSFTIGFMTMGYLSMRASVKYLELVRLNYQIEQQIMAIRAKKLGDMNQAIIHYSNLVASSSSPGLSCFGKTKTYWALLFPINSLVLEEISDTGKNGKSKEVEEGINRARLADALEGAGYTKEATSEYIKASHLLGCNNDIVRVKKIIKRVLASDEELLKLR